MEFEKSTKRAVSVQQLLKRTTLYIIDDITPLEQLLSRASQYSSWFSYLIVVQNPSTDVVNLKLKQ